MSYQKKRFCVNCGQEIPCDSRFCPECGATQDERTGRLPVTMSPEEKTKLDKRNKILGLVVGGALLLCIIIGIVSAFIKPTINLNKYLTVTFEGYDSCGKAVVTIDKEKFEKDYGKRLGKTTSSTRSEYYEVADMFFSAYVSGQLDKHSGLSNNDTVTFKWECKDEAVLEQYGYKLKYKDVEYKVLGLKKADTFDPFTGVEIKFEGIAPYGYASISVNDKKQEVKDLYFNIEPENDLSNGDTVTVVVSSYYEDVAEYCMETCGKIPSSTEKTFKVEGLNSYVSSMDEISDDSLTEMKNQAEKIFNENVKSSWDEDESLVGLTYLGNYLLTNKDTEGSSYDDENKFYLVYKVQVKNQYSSNGQTYDKVNDIYWYVAYSELLVNDKSVTTFDEEDYDTPRDRVEFDSGISSGWFGTMSWYYYGYSTLEELHENVVTEQEDIYKCESSMDDNTSQ